MELFLLLVVIVYLNATITVIKKRKLLTPAGINSFRGAL